MKGLGEESSDNRFTSNRLYFACNLHYCILTEIRNEFFDLIG